MLLSGDGVKDFVKVLDFGISQASWRPRLTNNEEVAGTPQYMAPEQARGLREEIDSRSDQFSLAAIAYVLLTGREPFRAEDPIAVLYQVVHADPPPPAALVPRLGPAVDAVIMKGLAKQSAERFGGVMEFAAALRQAIERVPVTLSEVSEVAEVGEVAAFTETVYVDEMDEPPPIRVVEFEPPTIPFDRSDPERPFAPAGRRTRRIIRRIKRSVYRVPRRIALLAFAAALTFAWFSPTARGTAGTVWRRAEAQAQRFVVPRLR
jgi:serine/threonine-protein kinase